MKEKKKSHIQMVFGIFLVSILLLLPMFFSPYHVNDDTWFHLINIDLIKEAIETHFWDGLFLKIIPQVGFGLGYGTRLFYPPLAHTLGAYLAYFLEFFSIDILWSLKTFHFLCMFLSGLSMYYCAYRFHKEKFSSFLASVIYMSSGYHMSEIYVRDALGEAWIFVFLPLIIVGVKELLDGNKKLFYPLFVAGYVGGILSHFTMMIYITLILGFCMLFFHKKIFRKDFLIPFLKGCGLVFLLTAFFFEPLFEHKLFGNYMVYKPWVMSNGIWHTALWGYEYFFNDPDTTISFCFSAVTLLLLGYVIWKKRKELWSEKYKLVTLFGIFSLWSSTRYFPWFLMPYTLFMIQFGWRLVSLVIFAVAILAPLSLKSSKNKVLKLFVVVFILLSGFLLPNNHRDVLSLSNANYEIAMGWQKEYLPVATGDSVETLNYLKERTQDILINDKEAKIEVLENHVPYLKFSLKTDHNVTLEFPRIFYFGYILKNENGDIFKVFENERGFVSANLPKGTYVLDFEGSMPYQICLGISIFTFFSIIFYLLVKLFKNFNFYVYF